MEKGVQKGERKRLHRVSSSKTKNTSVSSALRLPKEHYFLKVPRLRPIVLLVKATCGWSWLWSIGGMRVTGENRSTWRKTCHSGTVFVLLLLLLLLDLRLLNFFFNLFEISNQSTKYSIS